MKSLTEEIYRIKSIMGLITEGHLDLADDDWMDLPSEERAEKLFDKQTNLEKQFSRIVVDKLSSDDEIVSYKWATYEAVMIELKKLGEDSLVKEIEYRITDKEAPDVVLMDAISRSKPSSELERLKGIINDFKDINTEDDMDVEKNLGLT